MYINRIIFTPVISQNFMKGSLYNKFKRITSNQLYFPEIDGIRFLAILLVILFHAHGYFEKKTQVKFADPPASHAWIDNFLSKGDRGVELFFVLSGFILCMPFAQQYLKNGKKVILKKYYLRRVTRLEPPYILAITGIFVLQLALHANPDHYSFGQLLQHYFASLTYSHGLIYQHTPIITVVAWSLEIEIQFYILAPLFFRILSLGVVPRRVILVSAILCFVTIQHYFMPTYLVLTIYRVVQYFLIGILLADVFVSGTASDTFKKNWVIPVCIVLIPVICVLPIREILAVKLIFPFLIGLLYYMVLTNDAVKRVFSYKFVPIIGGMCYSIYLLHYTIISTIGRYTTGIRVTDHYIPNLLFQLAALLIPVLIVSSIFYLYIERPFMDKKWMKLLTKKE